jgi:hypothetical protein
MNNGCNGGSMDLVFLYTEKQSLKAEANCPFVAKTGFLACKYDKTKG